MLGGRNRRPHQGPAADRDRQRGLGRRRATQRRRRRHDATVYYDDGSGELTGSWCDLASAPGLCAFPLDSELPGGQGRSFAWPPRRVLRLRDAGDHRRRPGRDPQPRRQCLPPRSPSSAARRVPNNGAALSSPEEGWLGATPPLQLTRNPEAAHLQPWPVPLRRPLTAIAPRPGAAVGAPRLRSAGGRRRRPGRPLRPRRRLGTGIPPPQLRQAGDADPARRRLAGTGPGLRGRRRRRDVALAEGDRALAPDPGAPPNLARANFTGIAFDPAQPSRGYAVGKQGAAARLRPRSGPRKRCRRRSRPKRTSPRSPSPATKPWRPGNTRSNSAATPAYERRRDRQRRLRLAGRTGGRGGARRAVPQRVAGLPDGGAAIASLGSATKAGRERRAS